MSNDYHIRSRTLSFGKEIALDAQILKVKHLQKCFGKAEVLHDLNFTVSAGEVYGLIGQNGAGKTTLLRLIAGLMEPTQQKKAILAICHRVAALMVEILCSAQFPSLLLCGKQM